MPDYVHDFPNGAGRLIQKAEGYDYTLVNGAVFMESGEHTGALAGQLLRSGAGPACTARLRRYDPHGVARGAGQ